MSCSPDTLTCLKFLQSTLMTASDGRTDPADTEDRMAATVATPKVSLWTHKDKHNPIIISAKTWRTKSWFGLSCKCSAYYVKTYPDSPMTGAWLTDFSFRMSIVSRQDRDGNSVRGRDRWRHLTVTFHHLQKGKKSFRMNPQLRLDFWWTG